MIVLSLIHGDRTQEVRNEKPRFILGIRDDADVRLTDAGWEQVEAVLVHRGTEVLVERPGRDGATLRIGDELAVGDARIRLVGLLPLATPPAAEASAPVFGSYDDELRSVGVVPAAAPSPPPAGPGPFELVGELRPVPAPPPPTPPRAQTAKTQPPPRPDPVPDAPPPPPPLPPRPTLADKRRAHAFAEESFGQELVTQLRRAPYFTVSLAAHVLALLILSLIQASPEASGQGRDERTLLASTAEPRDDESFGQDDPLTEADGISDPELPELPEIEPPELELPERAKPKEEVLTLQPLPEDGGTIMPIGLNPSVNAVSPKDRNARPAATLELERDFGEGDKGLRNQQAADYVRARLGRGTGGRGDPFANLAKKDILVVNGTFDDIGRVLTALQLPYTSVPAFALTHAKAPDLLQHKVIFWNCGESLPPARQLIAARRIKEYVKRGGYLFTTDWGVGNVLKGAFPGYLGTTGPVDPLPEATVEILPAPGQTNHALLRGVFHAGARGKWWLEKASYDVKVLDKRRVTTLIISPELQRRWRKSPVVAVVFSPGKGRVLHIAGHYFQEMGNLAGTISAHRLALNFVLERLSRQSTRR